MECLGNGANNFRSNLSPLIFASGETVDGERYFFFPPACLAAAACFFLCSALVALACFCVDFFWFDFGDLSPMVFNFLLQLTHLRHVSFSGGKAILPAKAVDVNDGGKFNPGRR